MDPKGITEIIVADNGAGFTKKNIIAFGKLFTTNKKDKFNCKGIGRLSYFASFFKVSIASVYEENGKLFAVDETVTEHNFYNIGKAESREITNRPINTIVTLSSINPAYSNLYKIPSNTIRNEIVQHFLPSLLSIKNIKIKIIDDEEYYLDENIGFVTRDKPIEIGGHPFDIYHLKNKSQHRSNHKIILSADGRSVKEQTINFLPQSKIGESDDKFYLNTVVISEYLDKKLNPQRTDFDIPKTKENLLDDELTHAMGIDMDSIFTKVLESSRAFSQDSIQHFENVLDTFIEKTFEELPHLSFLREDKEVRNKLKLGDDASSVKDAYVKRFAEKQVESFNYVKSLSTKYESSDIPNFEEFTEESQNKLNEGMVLITLQLYHILNIEILYLVFIANY